MSATYVRPIGVPDSGGPYQEAPIGLPFSRLIGVVNDFTIRPVNGLVTGTTHFYTTPSKILLLGVVPWVVDVTASGTVASFSLGYGSSTTNLIAATAMTGGNEDDEVFADMGLGVWRIIPADTKINFAITTAAAGGFTKYDIVPLLIGCQMDRSNP